MTWGLLRTPGTKEIASYKWRKLVIREQVLLQQGMPLQPTQTTRELDRISVQTATDDRGNFLERFAEVQRVTSLLRKRGLVGPHLVETW